MVNLFTKGQSAIDLGNMYRQHELAIERAFITKCFATRLMTTFSGINFFDTFMAHMYFNEPYMFSTKSFDFREEMNKLAYSLLHNKVLAAEMASKNPHHTPRPSDNHGPWSHPYRCQSRQGLVPGEQP